jgi:cytochrome c553
MHSFKTISFCAALALVGVAHAEGDPEAGKAKTAACAACHGPDGNSIAPNFPNLAGQHYDYLVKQLEEYRSGERQNATMNGLSSMLSDQDIADISAYYAQMTKKGGEADPDKVELGETIYRAGNASSGVAACSGCHGPNGAGNPLAKFPSLDGQKSLYTADQLRYFRDGTRANDAGAMMRGVAGRMTDAEIEAVAAYIQGLQ